MREGKVLCLWRCSKTKSTEMYYPFAYTTTGPRKSSKCFELT